jgi:hypothetical protein
LRVGLLAAGRLRLEVALLFLQPQHVFLHFLDVLLDVPQLGLELINLLLTLLFDSLESLL